LQVRPSTLDPKYITQELEPVERLAGPTLNPRP